MISAMAEAIGPGPQRRPGTTLIHEFEPGEGPVAMCEHQGILFVATPKAIYRVQRARWRPWHWIAKRLRFNVLDEHP